MLCYTRAIQLAPEPLALNNLAQIRASHPNPALRDGKQAVELAVRCCQLTSYQVATPLSTLAAAYAEVGQFDDAIKWQTAAIKLARAHRQADLTARLTLYQAGKPYRAIP